ncbi:uncharacterized protein DUF3936 [Bacillus oleivorans]|uniref:Uncharacterized protein DUF3936 n=1 Tax=Bacillus oleivorans TaxID=1448271 RepID=A0A285CKH5_9BACI|nr:Z-ring formation inhibitor MciZ [Bacillus oleivorans]SNX68064.1 uncharacterized protein DUF3936 [Bacillus oleivorans]
MKCYVHEKGVILVGKAWQIKIMLTQYQKHYETLQEWVESATAKK